MPSAAPASERKPRSSRHHGSALRSLEIFLVCSGPRRAIGEEGGPFPRVPGCGLNVEDVEVQGVTGSLGRSAPAFRKPTSTGTRGKSKPG